MADFRRNANGTPYVSDPVQKNKDGSARFVLYSRPSGFTKQIENTYNLQKWSERNVAAGIAKALHDPLASQRVEKAMDAIVHGGDLEAVDGLADELIVTAKEFSRSSLAADRGTWVHTLTELVDVGVTSTDGLLDHIDAGVALGIEHEVQDALADAWRSLLLDHHLQVLDVELPVVNDEFRTAGTLDRIVRVGIDLQFRTGDGELVTIPAGTCMVLDLKTGALTSLSYWNAYSAQVYLYASSLRYDPDTNRREPHPFALDDRWGLLAHLDVKAAIAGADDIARLLLVDLSAGRDACLLAKGAKEWSVRSDVFAHLHMIAAPAGSPPSAVEQPTAGTVPASRPGGHLTPQQQKAVVPSPAEGMDTRTGKDWVDMESRYRRLPDTGKALLKLLMEQSKQAGVSWHKREQTSDRRWWLYEASISLAEQGYDLDWSCETLRALIAHTVAADWPLFPSLTTGHIFGSLDHDEAERLARAVRDLGAGGYVADFTRDVLELRPAA